MTRSDRRGSFARPILSLVTLIALSVLIALGAWQLRRLEWKRDLLRRIEALQSAPAPPVEALLAERAAGGDVDYVRGIVDCPGLDRAPFVTLYAFEARVTGVRIISACRLDGAPYEAVLVDRGFLSDAEAPRLESGGAMADHRPVVGVLRTPPARSFAAAEDQPERRLWYNRDIPAMAQALGITGAVAPVFLFLESPPPVGFGPRPAPLPNGISNRHLGYAITWFGLAAALAAVYLALILKGRNRNERPPA